MNFPRDTEHYCAFVSTNNAIVGHIIFYCKLKALSFPRKALIVSQLYMM